MEGMASYGHALSSFGPPQSSGESEGRRSSSGEPESA